MQPLSMIIPIKARFSHEIEDFAAHYTALLDEFAGEPIQIVIADESGADVYNYLHSHLCNYGNVVHFQPPEKDHTGANDKSNGVFSACAHVKHDNILLVDDHYRVSRENLEGVMPYFEQYDTFKVMPLFDHISLMTAVDLCGMFIINMLDKRKQYCGHLAMKKHLIDQYGFPDRDALYDEYEFEEHFRSQGCSTGFPPNVFLDATNRISKNRFFEQRVRYAYENLAFPLRFALFLSVIPILVVLFLIKPDHSLLLYLLINVFLIAVSFVGQHKYYRHKRPSTISWATPLWFLHYPVTTWVAVFMYFRGGVMFGGNRIRKAG